MKLPNQLVQFIETNSIVDHEDLGYLPFFYADINDFNKMQEGYRYNAVTAENLISHQNGDWQETWYVFAANQMHDPFFINFVEGDIGYPVYYATHGRGTWKPIKIADTLKHLEQIMKTITENAKNLPFALNSLSLGVDLQNEFWSEVNQSCAEFIELDTTDDADLTWYNLHIIEIGENRVSVMNLLRKLHDIPLSEIKKFMSQLPIFVCAGLKNNVVYWKEAYEQSGCVMQMTVGER
jgi:hypothetical protein